MVLSVLNQVTNSQVIFMRKMVNLKKGIISMPLGIDLRAVLMRWELELKGYFITKKVTVMKEYMTQKEDFYKVLYFIQMEINLLVNFAIRKK